jgi:transcriptional regulator with XRE-family HTH domain
LTQAEFGEVLGVSRDVIANLETGRVEPSQVIVNAVCREFNIDESWLRTGEGKMFNYPDNEIFALVAQMANTKSPTFDVIMATIKSYMKLDPTKQRAVDEFFKGIKEGWN